jgi:hypothetical protein
LSLRLPPSRTGGGSLALLDLERSLSRIGEKKLSFFTFSSGEKANL